MKAIVYEKYGSPDVLELKDTEKPLPKKDEVLVKIHAASVNSWDWDMLIGKPYIYRLMFGMFKPKHRIMGFDIAGEVEAVGNDIHHFKPGDRVIGDLSGGDWGGFAEFVCAKEKELFNLPDGISFEHAATIPQAGVLAHQSLYDKKEVKKGDKILINGAGGGVGTFALQIAKSLDATVTCVDSADKLDLLLSAGADHVIDYKSEDFTKNGQKYDLIIDVVAKRSIFTYQKSLRPNGVFIMIGGTVSSILQAAFIGPLISITSKRKLGILVHQPNKNLDALIKLYEQGILQPIIDKVYPLSETPEALSKLGAGHVKGKVVIKN